MNNFTQAMKFTSKWEGFFSNDKADPGGKTKYGVSDKADGTIDGMIDLDRDGTGDVAVEALITEQALKYYMDYYWTPAGCDALELPMAIAVFDTAVNCGVSRAKRWLRQTANRKEFITKRREYYYEIIENRPTFSKFKNGWLNRLNDLTKYTDILAKEMVP